MGWFGHLQWGGSATPFKIKNKNKLKKKKRRRKKKEVAEPPHWGWLAGP
jgi:hypothetical protein